MPEECASMRSIARWVLPVLVGPSTAVTPWPRARWSRSPVELNEIGIETSAGARNEVPVPQYDRCQRGIATPSTPVNQDRTKRARIADSAPIEIRSHPYV